MRTRRKAPTVLTSACISSSTGSPGRSPGRKRSGPSLVSVVGAGPNLEAAETATGVFGHPVGKVEVLRPLDHAPASLAELVQVRETKEGWRGLHVWPL